MSRRRVGIGLLAWLIAIQLGLRSDAPGHVVGADEVAELRGAGCLVQDPFNWTWVCYGGSCLEGGCGCAEILQWIATLHGKKPAAAAQCSDNPTCTAPLTLSFDDCTTGG